MNFSDYNPRELIEYLPEALFLEDMEGNILDVNSEACQLLGYQREELLGQKVEKIVPDQQPVFMAEEIDQATRASEPIETVNIRKDGAEVPVELRGRIVEADGRERLLVSVREISARKSAERELKEANQRLKQSRERYRSYFEELGDAVFITKVGGDDHGQILDVNSTAIEQTGYSREELIGLNIEEDIVVEASETTDYKTGEKKITEDQPVTLTEKKRRKDGTEYWTEVMITTIEYQGDRAALSINRDITERRVTKRRLEQYKMAVEGSEDLMAAFDGNYNYLFANEAYRDFHRMGREEIRDRKLGDVIGKRDFQEEVKPRVDRCLTGERIEYEMIREHPKLGERTLKLLYYPLEGGGEIQGGVAVIRDITARKQAEEELQFESSLLDSLLENIPDTIYFKNREAEFVRVSRSKAEEVGEDRREDLHGKTDFDYYPPEAARKAYRDDMQVINEEEPVLKREERHSKDGGTYWFEATKVPRYDQDGNLVGTLGISRDITERKKAEMTLNRERDRLKQLHEAVDEFQACQEEEQLYKTTLRVTQAVLDFDISLIYTCREEKLVLEAATQLDSDRLPDYEEDEGLAGKTLRRGETIWGQDIREEGVAKPEDPDLRAFMSVPIGEIGVFQAASKSKGAFTRVDVELAEILAGHLREEIKRIRLEEELKREAIQDPLTGLYNRRYFNESLQKEVEKCTRYEKPLSFLMMDVDRFKEINDRYSHQTGDRVLRKVANLLVENVRDADTVVRYGGDEFLVMMPETEDESESMVDRLRESLSDWNRNSELLDFPLTLAMGVSVWNPGQDRDVEEALKEADEKMYEDKGR